MREEDDPADSSDDQENGEGMIAHEFGNRTKKRMRRPAALSGSFFVHVLGGENGDQDAAPVGNGVSKKRSPVRGGIGKGVEHYPGEEDESAGKAEGVFSQERAVFGFPGTDSFYGHPGFDAG